MKITDDKRFFTIVSSIFETYNLPSLRNKCQNQSGRDS